MVIATYGRKEELAEFLISAELQSYQNFEIIIVDQNPEGFLDEVIGAFERKLKIVHMRSALKGLSVNRNIGLSVAKGEIFAFPDDDCRYAPETVNEAVNFFSGRTDWIYTCNAKTSEISDAPYFSDENMSIEIKNIFSCAISFTIFIKPGTPNDLRFDEKMGVGAKFGAAEETDLLLTLLHKGYRGTYFGDRFIYHPELGSANENKILNYAKGFGALYKKEIFHRKNLGFIPGFLTDLVKRVLFLVTPFPSLFGIKKNKRVIWLTFYGRLYGLFRY